MLDNVKKTMPVDLAVCAAAVSDLKPKERNKAKIKKRAVQAPSRQP